MLKQLTPEKLYESMTTGTHADTHADAAKLTDEQRVAIAEWVSGRRLGSTESGAANTMSNMCATHPPVTNLSAPSWNGWSPDMTKNNRFQAAKAAGGLGPRESGATEELRRHGFSPAAVAQAGAEVGVRTAVDIFRLRAADDRGRPGLHRVRFGISLFAGRGDWVRALVVSRRRRACAARQ